MRSTFLGCQQFHSCILFLKKMGTPLELSDFFWASLKMFYKVYNMYSLHIIPGHPFSLLYCIILQLFPWLVFCFSYLFIYSISIVGHLKQVTTFKAHCAIYNFFLMLIHRTLYFCYLTQALLIFTASWVLLESHASLFLDFADPFLHMEAFQMSFSFSIFLYNS